MASAECSALIADDEPAARRGVRQLLAPFPEFGVVGECRNGAEVLASLDTLKPDVVFLDVQMPGIDGFEVIRRRTPDRMPAVVFLTAYDEFAIQAFEAQALDYLVKPVTEARFAATIKRLTKQLRTAPPPAPEQHVVVTTSRGAVVLPLREIERRVRAHGFVRAHRRALVRLGAVRELTMTGRGSPLVVLSTGARIPISRRRRSAFAAAVRRQQC